MDKVIEKVKSLCIEYPHCVGTYQELVILYWCKYHVHDLFITDFKKLASPESICRAYRHLVEKGAIQLDDEPRTLTEVLDSDNTKRKTHNKEE